jgi:hypothetical protein
MELFFVFIIGLFGFVWFRNSVVSEIRKLNSETRSLRNLINRLLEKNGGDNKSENYPSPTEEKIIPPYIINEDLIQQESEPPVEIDFNPEQDSKIKPEPEVKANPEETFESPVFHDSPAPEYNPREYDKPVKESISKPTFWDRNPDLEKFIGENLINKIGIGILVLGIAYFVKFAIDKNWIKENGRVGIGILAGGILIGIAHRIHKSYKAFSSVLIGGGLAALYFTIAIGFHEYHIFSQQSAFLIMIVITAFAVALSIAYDRLELAVLAIIGGFASPFIVSTGEGNYIVLFTYLLILNTGMLVLAYRKKWNIVNILCYVFTVLIYGSWLVFNCLGEENAPYIGALIFASSFYILFFLMNIVYNVTKQIPFKTAEIGILLSNTFLYYAAGMSILYFYYDSAFQGLFTAVVGVFNFGFAFAFYKNKNIDRKLIFLLIGLVLTFLSLTAPVQLDGNYITLFWSAEAVLLLWFSQKSGLKLIKITAVIVNGLMCYSLLKDWVDLYFLGPSNALPVILNKAFITSVVSMISLSLSLRLMKNEPDVIFSGGEFTREKFKLALRIAFVAILYCTFLFELTYQFDHYNQDNNAKSIFVGIYNFVFLSAFYLLTRKRPAVSFAVITLVFTIILMLLYAVVFNPAVIAVRDKYVVTGQEGGYYYIHFILAALVYYATYIMFNTANKIFKKDDMQFMKWFVVVIIVFISSAELSHIVTLLSYSPGRIIDSINRQVFKAGYTVLWGVISLILMQQGMQRKDPMLRIISLTLFAVSIAKLFMWDIKGVSEAGRIAAFISLGVLLLVVSFMYQRLKNLILKDEPVNTDINP